MSEFKLKNGQTLLLRQARGEDAAACLAFLRTVGSETDYLLVGPEGLPGMTEEKEAAFLESCRDSEKKRIFLGFVEDELVCIADVEIESHPRRRHNAALGLSVRKPYWRQGIGSVCLEQIIRFCRNAGGVKNLCLTVVADNIRAIRLYQKYGFVLDGCRKKHFCVNGVYHDEAFMRLPL